MLPVCYVMVLAHMNLRLQSQMTTSSQKKCEFIQLIGEQYDGY